MRGELFPVWRVSGARSAFSGRRSGLRASALRLSSALHNEANEKKNCFFVSLIDRTAPFSVGTTDTTLWLPVRSLRRFADAALSSSAPVQPLLRLESYPARRLFIIWVGDADRSTPCRSHPDCRGNRRTSAGPARCAGPRQATPAGPAAKPPADPAGRPADRRERQTKPGERGQPTAPPGHLAPLAWLGGSSRSFPAAAAPVPPRGHQRHVSTLRPPFPPSPPPHLIGSAFKLWAAIELRGEGRTPGALREGLPPKPPAKVRPNKLGGYAAAAGPFTQL